MTSSVDYRGAASSSGPVGIAYRSPSMHCSPGSAGPSDPRILEHLKLSTFKHATITIPLHTVSSLNRIALGIRDDVEEIHIRINAGWCNACPLIAGEKPFLSSFCVHFRPKGWEEKFPGSNHWCLTAESPWEGRGLDCNMLSYFLQPLIQNRICNRLPSVASRRPLSHLKPTMQSLVDAVTDALTSYCGHCGGALQCRVSRPMPCCHECRVSLRAWPLSVRLSPLLRDPSVLDLLLTLLVAQLDVMTPNPDETPNSWPFSPPRMKAIIDTFPSMRLGITMTELVGTDPASHGRFAILDWLCTTFEGMLIPTPGSARIAGMPGYGSFIFLNTHKDRQVAFQTALRRNGYPSGGTAAFHGTPPHCLFSILSDGLKTARGVVWYSRQPAHSTWYIHWRCQYPIDPAEGGDEVINPNVLRGWKNSRYKNMVPLFGVEVAGERPEGDQAKIDQDGAMVRYLFLLPADKLHGLDDDEFYWRWNDGENNWLDGDTVVDQMELAYRNVHNGNLAEEAVKNQSAAKRPFRQSPCDCCHCLLPQG